MHIFEALDNIATNLPNALDGMRCLAMGFLRAFGAMTREGDFVSPRQIVYEARQQYPGFFACYSRALSLFETHWNALDKSRAECRAALRDLDGILAQAVAKMHTSPRFLTGWFSPSVAAEKVLVFSSCCSSPDPPAPMIVARLEDAAYREVLRVQGLNVPPETGSIAEGMDWLRGPMNNHAHSAQEFLAATALANDGDAMEGITNWQCRRFEFLSDLAHRAARLFRTEASRCRIMARDIEQWLEGNYFAVHQADPFVENLQTAMTTASVLAELVVCPLVQDTQDLSQGNPVFVEGVSVMESDFE